MFCNFRRIFLALLVGFLANAELARAATVVDFEDVPLPKTSSAGDFYNGNEDESGFASRGVGFNNFYSPPAGDFPEYWTGWAASNSTDTMALGFTNQFSAFPGSGALGSSNFGVANDTSFGQAVVTFSQPTEVTGAYLTNGTYAALSMLHGDGFAKQFGGPTGNDPDWFKLDIFGKDAAGTTTGTVEFYLADYRSTDSEEDYIVDRWEWVDLSPLGSEVKSLEFELTSTDNGMFGMNTPSYFLLDDLTLTDPINANFNGDAQIDAADLVIWETRFGALTAQGDSDGDFDVDGQDFLNWQRQLDVQTVGIKTIGVPEPTTVALFASVFAAWASGIGLRPVRRKLTHMPEAYSNSASTSA